MNQASQDQLNARQVIALESIARSLEALVFAEAAKQETHNNLKPAVDHVNQATESEGITDLRIVIERPMIVKFATRLKEIASAPFHRAQSHITQSNR